MKLDDTETDLMRHALGLNYAAKSFRNHFCAGPGHHDYEVWQRLVAKGFAVMREPSEVTGGDNMFHVTEEGKAALSPGGVT